MPADLKVLVTTAEVQPLIKTGGLADVTGALPAALRKLGVDARVLLPAYRGLTDQIPTRVVSRTFETLPTVRRLRLLQGELPDSGVPVYLIDCPTLYDRPGNPYADQHGKDHWDNALRFGVLSKVASQFGRPDGPIDWRPDIVHGHDWHAGLASAYLAFDPEVAAAGVFTIHNLAYQGNFDRKVRHALAIDSLAFHMKGLEFHGHLSFMKSGLFYADQVTTVSPTYAQEILQPSHGCGMDGVLREHSGQLTGILNGIDRKVWDPANDPALRATYGRDDLSGKAVCRDDLCEWTEIDCEGPVIGMLGRMTSQKGWDLFLDAAPRMVEAGARLVMLGEGHEDYEAQIAVLRERFPGRIGHLATFREDTAHRLIAGCDMLVVPSRFEPCGLVQMYALRYGTLPIVHRTGGLADSVTALTPASLADGSGTGFLFDRPTASDLAACAREALALYHDDPAAWREAQRNAMGRDLGWQRSAADYVEVYENALERRHQRPAVGAPPSRA
jgi:starch synthase